MISISGANSTGGGVQGGLISRVQGGTLATSHKSIGDMISFFTSGFCFKYSAKAIRSMCAHGFPSFMKAPESCTTLQSLRISINESAQASIFSFV